MDRHLSLHDAYGVWVMGRSRVRVRVSVRARISVRTSSVDAVQCVMYQG